MAAGSFEEGARTARDNVVEGRRTGARFANRIPFRPVARSGARAAWGGQVWPGQRERAHAPERAKLKLHSSGQDSYWARSISGHSKILIWLQYARFTDLSS